MVEACTPAGERTDCAMWPGSIAVWISKAIAKRLDSAKVLLAANGSARFGWMRSCARTRLVRRVLPRGEHAENIERAVFAPALSRRTRACRRIHHRDRRCRLRT